MGTIAQLTHHTLTGNEFEKVGHEPPGGLSLILPARGPVELGPGQSRLRASRNQVPELPQEGLVQRLAVVCRPHPGQAGVPRTTRGGGF